MSQIDYQSVRLDFYLSLCPFYSLVHVADTMKWIFLLFEFHWFLKSCLPGGRMTEWIPAFSTWLLDVVLRTTLCVKHLSMTRTTPRYGQLFPSSYFPLIFLLKISYCFLCPFSTCGFVSWATAQITLLTESTEGGHAAELLPTQLYWLSIWKVHPTKLISCSSQSSCELLVVCFLSFCQSHKKAEKFLLALDRCWGWSVDATVVAEPSPLKLCHLERAFE